MRFSHCLCVLAALATLGGCADRNSPAVEQLGGGHVDQSKTPTVDWPPANWPDRTDGESETEYKPPMSGGDFDFGQACSQPDGCESESADWPDCLNSQCNTGDCSSPIFTLDYGFCTRGCTDDSQCENAVPNGPYGDDFTCLTDGVSGTCAPGSNERCDYGQNGQCANENEVCKFSLIYAPDRFYGGVCQPETPEGRQVGESCDEEAGVYCANDMCLFDTCISLCDPFAEENICPTGFRCYDEWYPFGTDSTINIDVCLPSYCETDTECPDNFACVLTFQFNRDTILRGACLPTEDGDAVNGEACCTSETCIAQNPEVGCKGATCSGDEDGIGFCSGMCNTDEDCPGSAYCTIVNFGINAEPGSAPAQICQEGSGSGRPCATNRDCVADGDTPEEACTYVIRGELEGGRQVSETTVGGRCSTISLTAVPYGEACGDLAGDCKNEGLCLNAGGAGFCSEPCRNTSDCEEGSICFGLGQSGTLEAGVCVGKGLLGMPDATLTTCRRDVDCESGEHCGLNIIGSNPPIVETLCMTNEGAGAAGSECNGGMDCASDSCAPTSTDTTVAGYCLGTCRAGSDCGDGFSCERQVVDSDAGAEAKVCRPDVACTPCAFDNTAVCSQGMACSEVNYSGAGTGNACLVTCAGVGDVNCGAGFACAARIGEGGVTMPEFVCIPRDPAATCGAAQPR